MQKSNLILKQKPGSRIYICHIYIIEIFRGFQCTDYFPTLDIRSKKFSMSI